jgi:hypothetical protein
LEHNSAALFTCLQVASKASLGGIPQFPARVLQLDLKGVFTAPTHLLPKELQLELFKDPLDRFKVII